MKMHIGFFWAALFIFCASLCGAQEKPWGEGDVKPRLDKIQGDIALLAQGQAQTGKTIERMEDNQVPKDSFDTFKWVAGTVLGIMVLVVGYCVRETKSLLASIGDMNCNLSVKLTELKGELDKKFILTEYKSFENRLGSIENTLRRIDEKTEGKG